MDHPRRNAVSSRNAAVLQKLAAAGIPMRGKTSGSSLHWKFMLFPGQETLEVGAANFSDYYFIPVTPYLNYTDEAVDYTDDAALVDSFKTRMDDAWLSTAGFTNYANVHTTLARVYDMFPISPNLLFVPWENFVQACRAALRRGGDADRRDHVTKITRAEPCGRPDSRRETRRPGAADRRAVLVSEHVERVAGLQRRSALRGRRADRVRAHQGFTHEKVALLYGQLTSIFGSSNWTSESNTSQHEHNYFTKKSWIFSLFKANFERKWKNSTGNAETRAFTPLPP